MHISRVAIVKSEMRKLIKSTTVDSNYKILGFSKKEIYGEVPVIDRLDEKEFRYKGNMYDIFKERVTKDSVYFYCILDEKESVLELLFVEHFENQNNEYSPQKISSGFVLKLLPDYLITDINTQPNNYGDTNYIVLPTKLQALIYSEILTPPPQIS